MFLKHASVDGLKSIDIRYLGSMRDTQTYFQYIVPDIISNYKTTISNYVNSNSILFTITSSESLATEMLNGGNILDPKAMINRINLLICKYLH